jgi:hypothetical protein
VVFSLSLCHPLTTSGNLEYLIWKTIWTGQYHIEQRETNLVKM